MWRDALLGIPDYINENSFLALMHIKWMDHLEDICKIPIMEVKWPQSYYFKIEKFIF